MVFYDQMEGKSYNLQKNTLRGGRKKKKLLVIVLCLALTLPVLALAEGDGRVHITYSFWGNQTEAESVQQALDAYNEMQDKVFVEPMQIPRSAAGLRYG